MKNTKQNKCVNIQGPTPTWKATTNSERISSRFTTDRKGPGASSPSPSTAARGPPDGGDAAERLVRRRAAGDAPTSALLAEASGAVGSLGPEGAARMAESRAPT